MFIQEYYYRDHYLSIFITDNKSFCIHKYFRSEFATLVELMRYYFKRSGAYNSHCEKLSTFEN